MDNGIMSKRTYEDELCDRATEAASLNIMLRFRKQYGWVDHHPNLCCQGKHFIAQDDEEDKKQDGLPIMSADEYYFVLSKPEREKEEYKKRIFS